MNKTVLVTAGPTYEPIDPVRFIGNRSSGKQGIAIAKVFAENGYKVFLVVGPVNSDLLKNLDKNITIEKVNTAEEMLVACLKYIAECDIAVHSAAVSDYRPKEVQKTKIKKGDGFDFNAIEFVENADILSTFGHHENRPKILIGFAAETQDVVENGQKKLEKKNADYIIANDVSGGRVFGEDNNRITIISKTGQAVEFAEMSKEDVGRELLKLL
jgi:phosphopantothenoylcysteine decarboxylase/phosphopantothenate--cysteine ligase